MLRPPAPEEEDVRPPVPKEEEVLPAVSEEEEEEVWPPVWKSVEKSPQYFLIELYFRLGVDDFAHVYPPGAEGHDLLKRFFQQIRESRGYELDCPPRFLNSPFYPMPLKYVMNCEFMSVKVEALMKFVIGKVNAQAERHGEKYVLDKLKKVVDVSEYRTKLLTFTVKEVVPNPDVVKTVQAMVFHGGNEGFELQEWRFKPQVPEEEEVLPTVSEEEEVLPTVSEDEESEEEEEGEVWPPVWKSVKKSPQYCFIDVYFVLEVDNFAGKYPPGSEGHKLIKRFFQQVRESRGYDVDCHPPSFLYSPFDPWSIESVMNNEELSASVEARIKFATAEINAEAERHGEAYVLEKLEKVVDVSQDSTYLLTFTVKQVVPDPNVVKTVQAMVCADDYGFQLQDWRFKPQEAIITSSSAASREGITASTSITS